MIGTGPPRVTGARTHSGGAGGEVSMGGGAMGEGSMGGGSMRVGSMGRGGSRVESALGGGDMALRERLSPETRLVSLEGGQGTRGSHPPRVPETRYKF